MPTLTAGEIIDRIKANLGAPWREATYRDTFKFGGPDTKVTGIATTAFASLDVIQRAAKAGLNMIIPHEVTWWSDRDDTAYDLYVSKLGPNGWSDPENLGSNINRSGWLDEAVDFFEDEDGNEVMIFTSRLPNGTQGKIYQSVNGGTPSLVQGGPHSSASDARASVTNDGLTIFWDSTRTGTLGGPDIYYATRSSTSDPFGTAIHLQALSSPAFDARPYISKDGTFLTFSSGRTGSESPAPDMWFATRGKITGN